MQNRNWIEEFGCKAHILLLAFSNYDARHFPGAAFFHGGNLILTITKPDIRWSKTLSQQGSSLQLETGKKLGTPGRARRSSASRTPPRPRGRSGGKSLEALPASGLSALQPELSFLCLDLHLRQALPTLGHPRGLRRIRVDSSHPTLIPGPVITSGPCWPVPDLRPQPGALRPALLTRGSSSSVLGERGRGRWPPPRQDSELAREPGRRERSSVRVQQKAGSRVSGLRFERLQA